MATLLLSLEGNIGAGKSTLLRLLEEHLGDELEVLCEPLEDWLNCRGQNLLKVFYEQPERYSYMFQSVAFITHLMNHERTPQVKQTRLLERSILSNYLFAKVCHQEGTMNEAEWASYCEWYEYFSKRTPARPKAVIYLRTQPTTCALRILKRQRGEESQISLGYLKRVHEAHEQEFHNNQHNVMELDGELDFEHDPEAQEYFVQAVRGFISRLV